MDDLTKNKIENAKKILANGSCSGIECRFCFAYRKETVERCKAKNKDHLPIDGLSNAGIEFFKSKIAEYEGGEMKYKVGDMVKVREGIKAGSIYGQVAIFREAMVPYCGKIMKIKIVHKNHYTLENNDWWWTDEMLEPARKTQYDVEKPIVKYRVGDLVKVKEGLGLSKTYDGIKLNPSMAVLRGDVKKITYAYNDRYKLEGCDFIWSKEMLEPAVFKPHYDKETVYVNGMHFEIEGPAVSAKDWLEGKSVYRGGLSNSFMTAIGWYPPLNENDIPAVNKKQETRKEIRKRLLKL
jgi:hypothetical protein